VIVCLKKKPEPRVGKLKSSFYLCGLKQRILRDNKSSYRPHNPGHDYYAPGIYLITVVVRNRDIQRTMFGELNDDLKAPGMRYSDVGRAVMEEWNKIPAFEATKGRKVVVHNACCMPDHFHGVIEVVEKMDRSVGQVIWGFKVACTKRWREIRNTEPRTAEQPSLVMASGTPDLHRMSKRQRAAYYALHPEAQQPLWDDNYDDTICLSDPLTGEYSQRHFTAMLKYVDDNARRAIMRRLRPQFMQRCLHVKIRVMSKEGRETVRDYAAFGNLFLLRWAKKVQVFCHRKAADGHTPYETTAEYQKEREQWDRQIMAGGTVIVTPGISRGEYLMKERCIEKGYPLIHLQKEPIGRYWKPEAKRFDACSEGRLLILAPWKAGELGEVNGVPTGTDYSIFHNLNTLAEEICRFDGEAVMTNK